MIRCTWYNIMWWRLTVTWSGWWFSPVSSTNNILLFQICEIITIEEICDCSFCWYWWNCWPSLFKLSFHNKWLKCTSWSKFYQYSKICLNRTLNKPESCINQTMNKVPMQEIFVKLTCGHCTPVYSELKSWSQAGSIKTGFTVYCLYILLRIVQ